MKVIILAAGIGSRLGNATPKPLTVLSNGMSILGNQINILSNYFSVHDIFVVVGFKKEIIMEMFPDLIYVYNNLFDQTNTSKSLLKGLLKIKNEDVLWLNGDVVLDNKVIKRMLEFPNSCMAVNKNTVSEEEVKYTLNDDGSISNVSKELKCALGEAVGVNKVTKENIPLFLKNLESCSNWDYFEKGIEASIKEGLKIYPVDVSDLLCMEIDYVEDLEKVNKELEETSVEVSIR